MIATLRETTKANAEQDWLNTNLARIAGLLQGQRDLAGRDAVIMSEVTPVVDAQHGAFFLAEHGDARRGRAARSSPPTATSPRRAGPTASRSARGWSARRRSRARRSALAERPADYIKIASGLGDATPADLVVLPVLFEEQVLGVIELGALRPFTELHLAFLDQLVATIGVVLNTILANRRTEELLTQSQGLAQELQEQSVELQQTNAELEEKTLVLQQQNRDIEIKNREIELARAGLEEKAEQLAAELEVQVRVPGQHEPRAAHAAELAADPLPAAGRQRRRQPDPKQIEFAGTIHAPAPTCSR